MILINIKKDYIFIDVTEDTETHSHYQFLRSKIKVQHLHKALEIIIHKGL